MEKHFEKLTSTFTKIIGHPITFMLALILVLFWCATNLFTSNDIHQNIGDIIFGFTFLSLFIIQKSFNRYSALIHLKLNELISSHDQANNEVMNTHQKTEKEIIELSKEYVEHIEEIIHDAELQNDDKESK